MNRRLSLFPAILTTAVWVVCVAAEVGGNEGPTETVKRLLEAIRKVKDPSASAAAKSQANESLDIEGLSSKSLGNPWKEMDESGRKEFVALLSRVFEVRAYPRSADFFKELEVEFRGEEIHGDEARVTTRVIHSEEGRVDIDYELHCTQGRWIIHEVLMDDVPMGAHLRNEMRKIIQRDGYEELVRRLKKRIEAGESQGEGEEPEQEKK